MIMVYNLWVLFVRFIVPKNTRRPNAVDGGSY